MAENPDEWTFGVQRYAAEHDLPRHHSKLRPKKWAISAAREIASRSPYHPVPDGEIALLANDIMWCLARYRSVPEAGIASVWVSEPRYGVDALFWIVRLTADEEFSRPEDIATFNMALGIPVQPRETELIDYPLGPGAMSFAIVRGGVQQRKP